MPWCHTCRVEYGRSVASCPECSGGLTDRPAPERRLSAGVGTATLVVLATLPPEQALVASEVLDRGGVPNALRDAGNGEEFDPTAVQVLVAPSLVSRAHAVLRGRRGRSTLGTYLFVVAASCVFLSGIVTIVRWFVTGNPLP